MYTSGPVDVGAGVRAGVGVGGTDESVGAGVSIGVSVGMSTTVGTVASVGVSLDKGRRAGASVRGAGVDPGVSIGAKEATGCGDATQPASQRPAKSRTNQVNRTGPTCPSPIRHPLCPLPPQYALLYPGSRSVESSSPNFCNKSRIVYSLISADTTRVSIFISEREGPISRKSHFRACECLGRVKL